jgi:hypothetical protein
MSIITTQVKAAEFKYSTAFIHCVVIFFAHATPKGNTFSK